MNAYPEVQLAKEFVVLGPPVLLSLLGQVGPRFLGLEMNMKKTLHPWRADWVSDIFIYVLNRLDHEPGGGGTGSPFSLFWPDRTRPSPSTTWYLCILDGNTLIVVQVFFAAVPVQKISDGPNIKFSIRPGNISCINMHIEYDCKGHKIRGIYPYSIGKNTILLKWWI